MKKLFYLWTILMVAIVSVCFVSCSSDDDDEKDSSNSIVGTWLCDDDEFIWCFKANGTGYGEEFIYNERGKQVSKDIWPITYVYDSKRNTIVITELAEDGDNYGNSTDIYDVITLTSKKLILREQGDDDLDSFTRQD